MMRERLSCVYRVYGNDGVRPKQRREKVIRFPNRSENRGFEGVRTVHCSTVINLGNGFVMFFPKVYVGQDPGIGRNSE